jgi:hypothetical protein
LDTRSQNPPRASRPIEALRSAFTWIGSDSKRARSQPLPFARHARRAAGVTATLAVTCIFAPVILMAWFAIGLHKLRG